MYKNSLVVGSTKGDTPRTKLALYDMDGTIIVNKSKKKNPKGADDWVFCNPQVVSVVRKYYEDGYRVIILTNQKGISLGHVSAKELSDKVEQFSEYLGIELSCLMASKGDKYRKPERGMWEYISQVMNPGEINKAQCFFVGDAAGRPSDHSDFDRLFAVNSQLEFFTPEEHFLGQKSELPKLGLTAAQKFSKKTIFEGKAFNFDTARRESKPTVTASDFLLRTSRSRKEHILEYPYVRISEDRCCRLVL